MYKKMLLITSILIISGCAEKIDFTKGVSEEDKKLLSSDEGKIYHYKYLYITKNGFFPGYIGRFNSKITNYSNDEELNLKLFVDYIYANNLKKFRETLLLMKKRYPTLRLELFNPSSIEKLKSLPLNKITKYYPNFDFKPYGIEGIEKLINLPLHIIKNDFPTLSLKPFELPDIEKLTSPNLSLKEKQKIVIRVVPNFSKEIPNLDKDLKLFAKKKLCFAKSYNTDFAFYMYEWENNTCKLENTIYHSHNPISSESYSGGGGSSTQHSGCRIQTVYVPGGNGRTTQTRICN